MYSVQQMVEHTFVSPAPPYSHLSEPFAPVVILKGAYTLAVLIEQGHMPLIRCFRLALQVPMDEFCLGDRAEIFVFC